MKSIRNRRFLLGLAATILFGLLIVLASGLLNRSAMQPRTSGIAARAVLSHSAHGEVLPDAADSQQDEYIEFAEETVSIGYREHAANALQLHVYPVDGLLHFVSSNRSCVRVDARTGELYGVRRGTAYITVSTESGLSARCRVLVRNAPTRVSAEPATEELAVGESTVVSYTYNRDAFSCSTEMTSSDASVISVAGNTITAVGVGSAEISVETFNGKKSSFSVDVLPDPDALYAQNAQIELATGLTASVAFSANEGARALLHYESDDTAIATVDDNGLVQALNPGETVITATAQNGVQSVCTLHVINGPSTLVPDNAALTLGIGEVYTPNIVFEPAQTGATLRFESSAKNIVSVDSKGTLSARNRGSAVITVKAQNDVSCTISVTVEPYSQVHPTLSIAHRGASGTYPGNSLAAFSHAAELGADMVELDVRKSADNVLMVVHDPKITLPTGGSKAIASLTCKQIQDADENICTLDEALKCMLPYPVSVFVELKAADIEVETLRLIGRHNMLSRCIIGSFSLESLNLVKLIEPQAQTFYLVSNASSVASIRRNAATLSCDYVSVRYSIISGALVKSLHLAGKKVVVWTVNSPAEITSAISMGVDGITTDYPDRV